MRVVPVLAATVLLTAAMHGVSAQNWRSDRFTVGNWQGAAYDGGTDRFTHCAITAPYVHGTRLFFTVNANYAWTMAFHNSGWNLTPGRRYRIEYYVDSSRPRIADAIAREKNFAVADMPASYELFQQFRRGNVLTVLAEGSVFKFSLVGTNAAFAEMWNCVSRNREVASRPSPFSPDRPVHQPSALSGSIEERLEATKFVANLMSRAEMKGFRILTDSELRDSRIPENIRAAAVAWLGPNVLGALYIVPASMNVTIDQITSAIISVDSQRCAGGAFASGSVPDPNSQLIRRQFSACTKDGSENSVYYLVLMRPDRSYYTFTLTGTAKTGPQQAEESIRQAVYRVVGQ